jgi:hypothetical protein
METPIIVFCMDNSAFTVASQDGSLFALSKWVQEGDKGFQGFHAMQNIAILKNLPLNCCRCLSVFINVEIGTEAAQFSLLGVKKSDFLCSVCGFVLYLYGGAEAAT